MDETAMASYRRWYETEYKHVLSLCAPKAHDVHHAQEAATEAFMKAWERWTVVSEMDNPTAWVTRVAINNFKYTLRRRSREWEINENDYLSSAQSMTFTPLQQKFWKKVGQSVGLRQYQVLVAIYYFDMTQEDVARHMKVKRTTVGNAHRKALAKLSGRVDLREAVAPA